MTQTIQKTLPMITQVRELTTQIIESCEKQNAELKKLGVKENPIIISPWHLTKVLKLDDSKVHEVYKIMLQDDRLTPRETNHPIIKVFSLKTIDKLK